MTVSLLLDSNILSEPSRPMPNAQVLRQLNLYRSEVGKRINVIFHTSTALSRTDPVPRSPNGT